jgi:tRNA A-37 threonylcarbamoyl transferase component Bud32
MARFLEARAVSSIKHYLRERSRKALKENLVFERLGAGGIRWHVRKNDIDARTRAVLADPSLAFADSTALVKEGRATTIARRDGLIVKRFNLKRWRNLVVDAFRESRALRAFRTAYHLELLGIPTPKALAAGRERLLGLVRRSYLVTLEIPKVRNLVAHLASIADPGRRRAAIEEVGALVARLHREGYAHRDLKATNILVDDKGALWLVDLDGLVYRQTVPAETRKKNIARLLRALGSVKSFDEEDRAALLRAYEAAMATAD